MILPRLVAKWMLVLAVLSLVGACAESPPPPAPPPPMPAYEPPPPPLYFVNVASLALREGPTTAAPMITTLNFNEEVELLNTDPGGWARVRELRQGIVGWASMRYLQPMPSSRPRYAAPKRRAPAASTAPAKKTKEPAAEHEEAPEKEPAPAVKPKIM